MMRLGEWRQGLGLFGTAGAVLLMLIAPLGLSLQAQRMSAIFVAAMLLWITEAIPLAVTGLLIPPALVIAGIARPSEAFASFADPVLFIFMGGFFIAKAMQRHGLDRRIANAILLNPRVARSQTRVQVAIACITFALSMWISNTASAAIMVPIVIGMLDRRAELGLSTDDRRASASLLIVTYLAAAGGMATLVGTPPNLMTTRLLKQAGFEVSFADWFMVGAPVAVVIATVMIIGLDRLTKQGSQNMRITPALGQLPAKPWSRGEKVTLLAFFLAVIGWTLPVFVGSHPFLEPGIVAIVASSILFIVREKNHDAVLPWHEATHIDWGTILLFAGGIGLGTYGAKTGLVAAVSDAIIGATGIHDLWSLTLVATIAATIVTELCSNVATANMLVPFVIGTAQKLGLSPLEPALAVGLAASSGFMMPISTGSNAIVYATAKVPLLTMIRLGVVLDLICIVIIVGLVHFLCPLIYGT